MTAEEVQTQLTDAACVNCLSGTPWLNDIVQTVILWKILNGDVPMTASDVQTLLDDSACLNCLSGTPWQLKLVQTILLWQIQQGGGTGGGSGRTLDQEAGPVSGWAAPSDTTHTWYKFNSTDGIIYVWNTDSQAWEPSA